MTKSPSSRELSQQKADSPQEEEKGGEVDGEIKNTKKTKTSYLKTTKKAPKSEKKSTAPEKAAPKKSEAEMVTWADSLNQREVALIDREIKTIRMQEELDRLRPLSGLYRVVKAMATERKLDPLLETIARETQNMLDADRCSVFVVETDTNESPPKEELMTRVAQGLAGFRTIRIPLTGASIAAYCARSNEIINIPDAYCDERFDPEVDKQTGYRTTSVLCVPMMNRSRHVIGVFQVLNKRDGPFTSKDEDWLVGLAAVASGLIEQAQAYHEVERFANQTLEVLAATIDKRDPLTAGHSKRVMGYSQLIGAAISIPQDDVDVLKYAAMMHDYGKIGVPEDILWKNGRLTPEEYALVQTHARITFDLLSQLPFTRRLAAVPFIASCHHEKLDGTGYYRGLRGEEIPFLARIIAVADVFDALTSVRHYRNRMPIEKVYEIIDSGRDNHFDRKCVDAFMKLPSHQVLRVMETDREHITPETVVEQFRNVSWYRLTELVAGALPKDNEGGLRDAFDSLYNIGLPKDYQALD